MVATDDLSVDYARGSYIGVVGASFPVVGSDGNVILKPTTAESLVFLDSRFSASNALGPGGNTLSGRAGKTE